MTQAPIILTGRGGSGTRLLSDIASASGVFLGNDLNVSSDSVEWVDLIYKIVIGKMSGASAKSFSNELQARAKNVVAQRPGGAD
jgi:hypothetical protein